MSHHLSSDLAYLRELGAAQRPAITSACWVRRRAAADRDELGPAAEALSTRLRGPVGLDIGAVTPEAIGLAIVSRGACRLAGRPCGAVAEEPRVRRSHEIAAS